MQLIRSIVMLAATLRTASCFSAVPVAFRSAAATATTTSSTTTSLGLLNKLFSTDSKGSGEFPVMCEEAVMSAKKHGTSDAPVQTNLRWACDFETADRICNFNRHYAEYGGYWQTTDFLKAVKETSEADLPIQFYDSVTGTLLFTAPVGRSMESFLSESQKHGWPSFRDEETNWEHVRCLKNGECVSTTGTHLGHNLPDGTGNRYCINLVSVAGEPQE